MDNISALLFPDTVPEPNNIASLLYFFNTVTYYLPVEADASPVGPQHQLLHGLCTGYAPAPLGNDLDRFNRLIRELETSRSEELTRLFSFAKTEFTTGLPRDREESSAGTILAALHKKTPEPSQSEPLRERLWQARLVLKLAEILDRKEAEVSNGLAAVADIEQKLYGSLRGDDEPEEDKLVSIPGSGSRQHGHNSPNRPQNLLPSQADLLIPLRIKAWAELFLYDSLKPHPHILTTGHRDAAVRLIDGCENIFHKQPTRLFSLVLPIPAAIVAKSETAGEFVNQREELQADLHDSLAQINQFLMDTAGLTGTGPDKITTPATIEKEVAAWNESIHRLFPGSSESSNSLDFYCFPSIAVEQLFQRLFHLDEPGTKAQTGYPTGIIAVFNAN